RNPISLLLYIGRYLSRMRGGSTHLFHSRTRVRRALCVLGCTIILLACCTSTAFAVAPVTNVNVVSANGQVDISWDNPADPSHTDTLIYRKTAVDGAWVLIQTVAAPSESWSDFGVTNGSDYWYSVRAYDAVGAVEEPEERLTGGLRGYYYDNDDLTNYRGT